jgi:uncharacterized protein with WD repeat
MHLPWSRRGRHCPGAVASDADRSLRRAEQDVAEQTHKFREEHEVIERLKTIRAHNGLADALYVALTHQKGGPR